MTNADDTRITALIIRPGSPVTEPSRIDPDVSLYQRIVQSEYIDAVDARTENGEPVVIYIGDTSRLDESPENVVATRLWHSYNAEAVGHTLYGTAIVVGAVGPEDADVPESVIHRWRRIVREVEVEGLVEKLREQGD